MDSNIEKRVEEILSQMGLNEKVALLSGIDNWQLASFDRFGVPALVMTDGPHGVRGDEANMPGRPTGLTTAFPTGVSMAATWNPGLVERAAAAMAEETLAMGCDVLLGPCVNIVRHPLAGRNFEAYSEDPYLAGKIGIAWVRGLQSKGVGASLKHFACNNQEYERFRGDSIVDERTLREIYLPQFEMVVKEAQPWTVMCSYNRLNGDYASQNRYLLTKVLREEWGFEGFVVSDWGANHSTVDSVTSGLDLEMPGPEKYYGQLLRDAVLIWQIEPEKVEEAARRILRIIARSGRLDEGRKPGSLNTTEHHAVARELAEEAITLLKNDGGLLPLNADEIQSLAVIGPNAEGMVVSGGGSSRVTPPEKVTPLEALQAKLPGKVVYEQGCSNREAAPHYPESIRKAAELAKSSSAAIVFVGMPEFFETEGQDRPHMHLTGDQDQLVREVLQANPKSIVVLNCGAPVEMPWSDAAPTIVQMYYPGMQGGEAIARVLLGEVNPSGKLPVTYPRRLEDTPAYVNYPGGREVYYGERLYVGYRYYQTKGVQPLFPFGHGLSYTHFNYSRLRMPERAKVGEAVGFSVQVSNLGKLDGKETVQVYVHDAASSLDRPESELKAFQKVALKAGESIKLEFALDERAFAFYDPLQEKWVVEPGEFQIRVGSSSEDIRCTAKIILV